MKARAMDPALIQAWNKGREAGKQEATEMFHEFLIGRMETLVDLPGVGDKTAWKIQEHFLKEMEEAK